MRLRLVVTAGPDHGCVFEMQTGELLLVGRGSTCEIQLHDPTVSRLHCRLHVGGGKVQLFDAGSHWGTTVNGEKVSQHQLQPGDLVVIGETELRLEMLADAASTTLAPRTAPGRQLLPTVDRPAGQATGPATTSPVKKPGPAAGATPQPRSVPVVADLTELAGKTLLRYNVGELLARARTGLVFRAVDTKKHCDVALKVFWPELTRDERDVRRFLRAIRTMLPLRHPNLVALFGAGKHRSYCWTASEFVDGENLAEVIRRIGISGMLDWQHAFRVALHIGRGLEFAHEHHVVHRNITPRNILVRKSDGVAKLGDLMLAKALDGVHAERITERGELVGELAYMSPEQTLGNQPIDGRSDLYNLGATLYALLTGRPPCEGRSAVETITKIQTEDPVKPTKYHLSIPPLFEGVVLRMLAKWPDDRYQTPAQLIADLERVARYSGLAEIC